MDELTALKAYLPQVITTLIIIILLPLSKIVTRKLVRKYGSVTQISEPRIQQMRQVISILLNITFFLILAIVWGVRPQNILLGLSSIVALLGVALFAQWSILSNVTAGIVMFFSAPYRVGDSIHIIDKDAPITAVIENIGTFYTHIRTEENELIVLPNNLFLQKIVSVKKGNE